MLKVGETVNPDILNMPFSRTNVNEPYLFTYHRVSHTLPTVFANKFSLTSYLTLHFFLRSTEAFRICIAN